MSDTDQSGAPAAGADGPRKARSRSPSVTLSQAAADALLTDGSGVDRRRKSRPSTRESSTSSRIDHRGQPQVFNLDAEQRGRAGSR